MEKYVIGLDIGTTCAKALAVDVNGQILAGESMGYPLLSSENHVEQRAQDWIDAMRTILRALVRRAGEREAVGISLSTQGATTVAVDAQGQFLGNAVTWMDTSAEEEARQIEEELGGERVYRISGWKINPALDAAKLRHMQKNPLYAGASQYLSTLEVANKYLTGNACIDPSNAAIRQLFDVEAGQWSRELLRAAGIAQEQLPPVLPTGAVVGLLSDTAARETGLPEGMRVYNGAHDQYCAAIGAGAVHEGDMLLSAGTTWVLNGISRKPLFTRSFIAPGKHPEEGLYGAIASLACSGASLEWFKNNFLKDGFEKMNQVVTQRRDKTQDLFFYPYLVGANYPIWNLRARGAFTGLALEHDRFDLARAIMEGVAFGVRRGVCDFLANGTQVKRITIMGGAAKSDVWCQMIADITQIPIERFHVTDICAVGAAAIALKGAGMCHSYAEASARIAHPERVFLPDKNEAAYFDGKFAQYDAMWECMQAYYRRQ